MTHKLNKIDWFIALYLASSVALFGGAAVRAIMQAAGVAG